MRAPPAPHDPEPLLNAVARLAAWKLGLYGVPAGGRAALYSSNDGSSFPEGTRCVFATISGHRNGWAGGRGGPAGCR
ncbi:hypothetical protein [Streptomyces benahoarensis]|uniref:Uncharacterized protein n=1 Tax=Streptomyces benahoarensis TaxID=2595054 RepID=A0A553YJL4_9ACTN|nr:hypothetical protein [Streptomyces benahoarensis]TSB20902.1 hypothetical protein FNJ62_20145 [Streptomyces benahoarensis]TSB29366.1 hypothetical protein FNZ23_26355 [Streptomyces benahoarensis]